MRKFIYTVYIKYIHLQKHIQYLQSFPEKTDTYIRKNTRTKDWGHIKNLILQKETNRKQNSLYSCPFRQIMCFIVRFLKETIEEMYEQGNENISSIFFTNFTFLIVKW